MHPVVKRYLNVAIDGLVQALVVAVVGVATAAALVIFGHLHGPWTDRLLGVMVGIIFVPLAVFALKVIGLKRAKANALLEIPKGFLDYKFEAETSLTALTPVANKLTIIMGGVHKSISKHTNDLQRARSTHTHLKVSQAASASLDKQSVRMERALRDLNGLEHSLSEGLNGWMTWMEKTHVQPAGGAELISTLREVVSKMQGTTDTLQAYINATNSTRDVSQTLNAAAERHASVVTATRQTYLKMRAGFIATIQRLEGLYEAANKDIKPTSQ